MGNGLTLFNLSILLDCLQKKTSEKRCSVDANDLRGSPYSQALW